MGRKTSSGLVTVPLAMIEALQVSEQRLAETQRLAAIGSWSWDVATDQVAWSDELYRIFGLEPQARPMSYADYLDLLPEQDRGSIEAAVSRAVEEDVEFCLQHDLVLADGTVKRIEGRGMAVRDGAGQLVRLVGSAQDVTRLHEVVTDLRAAQDQHRQLMRTAPDAVVVIDAKGRVREWNPAAERTFGFRSEDLLGRPLDVLMSAQDAQRHRDALDSFDPTRPGSLVGRVVPMSARHAAGHLVPVELAVSTWQHDGDRYYTGILRDVTDREQAALENGRHKAFLEAMSTVAGVANEAVSLELAVRTTLGSVAEAIGWPVAHALVSDPGSGELSSCGYWYPPGDPSLAPLIDASRPGFPVAACLPGRVARSGEAAWSVDVRTDEAFARADAARASGVVSALAAPVVVGAEVVGVLEFFASSPAAPTVETLGLLAQVGATLGRLIERQRVHEALTASERRLSVILDQGLDVVAVLDAEGAVRYTNRAVSTLLGQELGTVEPAGYLELVDPADVPRLLGFLDGLRQDDEEMSPCEVRVRGRGGQWRVLRLRGRNLLADPAVRGLVLQGKDITAEYEAMRALDYAVLHDELTGLANRALFREHTQRACQRRSPAGSRTLVLALDLDGFADVNERLGHAGGDEILKEVGDRLLQGLRGDDRVARPVVARPAGDEFLILCEEVPGPAEAQRIAERVLARLAAPLTTLGGAGGSLSACVGVVLDDGGDAGADDLLIHAEAALRQAKSRGRHEIAFYDAAMREQAVRHADRVRELRSAIEDGQLRLHYQPKVDLLSRRMVGVEALVRWEHPDRGLVPPSDFIPLAEESGLIHGLGAWVLEEAVTQSGSWQRARPEHPPLIVCINLSTKQFTAELPARLAALLERASADPSSISLEITESFLMADVAVARDILGELKQLGVVIALDDFGTGYSSLAYLRQLPIDEIKIDRSFVAGVGVDAADSAVVAATIAMSHALGQVVVAEGIETTVQLTRLRELGCEVGQGYLFSRPVDALALEALIGDDRAFEHAFGEGRSGVRRVLVVDDTAHVRQLAVLSLSTAGFQVSEAVDGVDGLEQCRSSTPDCLVLDLSMPGMDGLELCRALRADPKTSDCAVLVLSARADAADKQAAFAAGADDYMVKPFAPRDLAQRVRDALSRRESARAQHLDAGT